MSGAQIPSGQRRPLRDLPISAPIWLWLAYAALILTLVAIAGDVMPIVAAAFSFQFWSFAIHRGLIKRGWL